MKELDLLKKDWQKSHSFNEISEAEIYKMIHLKSSSIVKRILIISVVEFLFWSVLTIFISDDQYQVRMQRYGIADVIFCLNVINYTVLVLFIFFFYKNYRTISTTDSTRQLMKNILKTRKTVQYYIWYNLGIVALNVVLALWVEFYFDDNLRSLMENAANEGHKATFLLKSGAITIIFIALIFGFFWLFYRLLYGILLKRLYENYKELKKTEN